VAGPGIRFLLETRETARSTARFVQSARAALAAVTLAASAYSWWKFGIGWGVAVLAIGVARLFFFTGRRVMKELATATALDLDLKVVDHELIRPASFGDPDLDAEGGWYRFTAIVENRGRGCKVGAVALQGMRGIDREHFQQMDEGGEPNTYGDFNLQWDVEPDRYRFIQRGTTWKLHVLAIRGHNVIFLGPPSTHRHYRSIWVPERFTFSISLREVDADYSAEVEFAVATSDEGKPLVLESSTDV
jgi:hypothetical protein